MLSLLNALVFTIWGKNELIGYSSIKLVHIFNLDFMHEIILTGINSMATQNIHLQPLLTNCTEHA